MKNKAWNIICLLGAMVIIMSLIRTIIGTIHFHNTAVTSLPLSTAICFDVFIHLGIALLLLGAYLIVRKFFLKSNKRIDRENDI